MNKFCIFLFSVLVTLTSCTSYVSVKRTIPARYQISGIKKVVFTQFPYEATYHKKGSKVIPEKLEEALEKNGFFEIVDSPFVTLKMDEKLSTSKLRRIGRKSKADAVISGKVMAYQVTTDTREIPVEKEVVTGSYRTERYEENGETRYRQVPVTKTETFYEPQVGKAAEVSFYADLVNTRTGKRLDHRYFTKIGTERAQGREEIKKMSGDDKMLHGVAELLAKKFVLAMTPHEVTQKLNFKSEKECKEGIKLAKNGKWSEARLSWQTNLNSDPNSSCSAYNLGVYHEAQDEYSEALAMYKKASRLVPQEELFTHAVKRVKNIIQGEKILKKQMRGRKTSSKH